MKPCLSLLGEAVALAAREGDMPGDDLR